MSWQKQSVTLQEVKIYCGKCDTSGACDIMRKGGMLGIKCRNCETIWEITLVESREENGLPDHDIPTIKVLPGNRPRFPTLKPLPHIRDVIPDRDLSLEDDDNDDDDTTVQPLPGMPLDEDI